MPAVHVLKKGRMVRLLILDSGGRITIPKEIREQFKGYGFTIDIIDGKIVLDPVKLEG